MDDGRTSLAVYNTVSNITEKNDKYRFLYTEKMLTKIKDATEFVSKIKSLYETSDDIEKVKKYIVDNFIERYTFSKTDYDYLKKIVDQVIQNIKEKTSINVLEYIASVTDSIEIELPPGANELVDIIIALQQKLIACCNSDFKLNIEADTISMKSVLLTSTPIHFNSELNELLRFSKAEYSKGTHISEKPVVITTTDKIHLKCDCVDGSIVNGIREQILFSFNLSAPPGYKIIKKPIIISYKKLNKTWLDNIQFLLEDNNHDPVDFNSETLTFTIQIIKIYYKCEAKKKYYFFFKIKASINLKIFPFMLVENIIPLQQIFVEIILKIKKNWHAS